MKTDQNSYQEYKKYLQSSLGISSLPVPKHPMNPYMRFYLQRSSEERTKGSNDWNALAKTLAIEWKNLAPNKKDFYQKLYNIRTRERNSLMQEYLKLSGKQKILSPYARFVKKRYAQYSKQYKNSTSAQINKLVKNDWKGLGEKEKTKLQSQYQKEKNDANLEIDNSDRQAEYRQRLQKYNQLLKEDREKILKKYGITKESKARLKRQEREQQRLKKRAQRQLQRQQRKREKQQEKRKIRQAKLKKLREEREAQRKLKEEEKQKQNQEKQKQNEEKLKAKQEAQKKKEETQNGKKKQTKSAPVKIQQKKSNSKSKSKPKATSKVQAVKVQPKKSQKTKKIKKGKQVKKERQVAKAKPGKQKSKSKAKAKGKKGKNAKGAKRGKK